MSYGASLEDVIAFEKCIGRLTQAAGRQLTDDEVAAIFERIHKAALDVRAGRVSPADIKLGPKLERDLGVPRGTGDDLIGEAAQRAVMDIEHEAVLRERRAALQLTKIAARLQEWNTLKTHGLAPLDAVEQTIVRDYSGQRNVESLEQRARGINSYLMSKVRSTWDSLGNDWLGFFQDRTKLQTLVRELLGENTGDAVAKKGAAAFHDAAEEARQMFNALGGDIGKLDDPYMPQHHSQEKVAKAAEIIGRGKTNDPAANRAAWVDYMTPRMLKTAAKGKYYIDEVSGQPWSEGMMRGFLEKAWDTVSSDGIANLEPGQRSGTGARANRHAEHRQIHFADAQDVLDYWNTFGDKSAIEILDGHLDRLAKDIAFVEKFGPNPQTTFQTLRDTALQEAVKANPKQTENLQGRAAKLDALYAYAAGQIKPSANVTVSAVADGIAHLNVAGKLGGSAIASFFGDKPIYEAVSHLNEIPAIQRWRTEVALLNPANAADRRVLERQGLMVESVRSGLNRFYEGLGGGDSAAADFRTTTGKWANAVMRITGMTAINDLRKGAFGVGMFHAIGSEIADGKNFADLKDSDVRALTTFGVTERDWATWKLAPLDTMKIGGQRLVNSLTPEAISRIPEDALRQAGIIGAVDGAAEAAAARRDAIVKLLGVVNTESDFAIVTPGWKERAQFYSGLAGQRGTVLGEISRSWFQFKSFPWAQFQRGMDLVVNSEGPASKAAMTAYLMTSLTLAGAMIMQTREMLSGKDPRKVFDQRDWYKFWGKAFLQGGALGIYGDFLYGINQSQGHGAIETLAGPTLGPLLEMAVTMPLGAAVNYAEGKQTHLAAQILQDAKTFVPGGNVWYAKAAMDHMVWQKVMEQLSPGYLATVRNRTMKDTGQDWWWRPGETLPERAPDLQQITR